ncbi:Transcription factor GLABRA 3 [Sesamum alatum]|uniref:Transcription factor GLABRA 3 n=1 Tax=Sesamum alatum TaxID=300844 RepID=A0AAE2CHT4_9LAMI|nr:Transcription factor GLABRA 3 [Sesamum alatum]
MDTGNQSQKGVPDNLRKQLALAVRSIQWSYAIFWSISDTQSGALEWGCGYYNGDIKTRKTVQAVDVHADELGLQRGDQLRELYESLSLGETSPQPKRPTAALSPEDLTDAEWYFLVCMSFVFNIGQGLPGRTLARNETVWLRNAHRADTKVFSRSLLAKAKNFLTFLLLLNYRSNCGLDLRCFLQSASIQTVACFPHLGGVIELGTTELVSEDLNLIQHIKTSFLESPSAVVFKSPDDGSNGAADNNDIICEVLDDTNMPENNLDQLLDCGEMDVCSPDNSSDDFPDNLLREESHLEDGVDGEAPPMQNGQFKNDSISNNSMNSSDCVSQTYGNPETSTRHSDGKKAADSYRHGSQKCNQQKNNSSGFQGDDIHYQVVLSSLLKSSHQLVLGSYCRNRNRESSFVNWKDRPVSSRVPQTATPQRLLKKTDVDEIDRTHVLSERKRREKLNERFTTLGSLVPSGGKVDKVSILDHTIEYLRELERKVEELESTRQSKPHDAVERTSDNYGPNKNKRKACETDKTAVDSKRARLRDSSADSITVSIADKDVLIEIRCSWRECVLVQVMEAVSKLHLDSQTVQSSNVDGILSVSIKAKCKGLKGASAGVIRQALQKVIRK